VLAFYVVLLGIIEGVTEWLPVSSTGHLILARGIMKTEDVLTSSGVFLYVIQLGAILAVLTVYGKRFAPRRGEGRAALSFYAKLAVASVPAALAGLLLHDAAEKFETWRVVAGALFFYGVLFIVVERMKLTVRYRTVDEITLGGALAIGAFQVLSVVPGTSRSGSTILGGMIAGCSREAAAEFSFFLAVPVIFGASALKIAGEPSLLTGGNGLYLLLGTATAYLVSLGTIRFLTGFVKKHTFTAFGVYRIILASAVTVYYAFFR